MDLSWSMGRLCRVRYLHDCQIVPRTRLRSLLEKRNVYLLRRGTIEYVLGTHSVECEGVSVELFKRKEPVLLYYLIRETLFVS